MNRETAYTNISVRIVNGIGWYCIGRATNAIRVISDILANRAIDSDRHTAFWDEGWVQEMVSATEDSKEGMLSFVERRPAEFKGW